MTTGKKARMTIIDSSDESLIGHSWTTDEEGNHEVGVPETMYSDDLVSYLGMLLEDPYYHWLIDQLAAAHLLNMEPKKVTPEAVENLKASKAKQFHLMQARVEKEAFLEYQMS